MDPPPLAQLPDELIEEILLRIPPSDPKTLARAAVAQKRWCRLIAGPSFRRRYRDLHRAAPMLGFLCEPWGGKGFSTSFVPTSSFRPNPRSGVGQLGPVDARHGRVLLRAVEQPRRQFKPWLGLVVWDPITGHLVKLPRPRGFRYQCNWKATVLCAAPAVSCRHLDCHRGHFIVVLMGDGERGMLSCVYSSEDGAWSKVILAEHISASLGVYSERSAHVGNALYCMLGWGKKILKYDLDTLEFSVIEPPPLLLHQEFTQFDKIELTTMEDGQLGLAVLCESTLYILSTDEEFGWGGTKMIDLKKCGIYAQLATRPSLLSFAGEFNLVFMEAGYKGILSVDIRSAQVKVVGKKPFIFWILPYISFCIPELGAAFRDEGSSEGGSNE